MKKREKTRTLLSSWDRNSNSPRSRLSYSSFALYIVAAFMSFSFYRRTSRCLLIIFVFRFAFSIWRCLCFWILFLFFKDCIFCIFTDFIFSSTSCCLLSCICFLLLVSNISKLSGDNLREREKKKCSYQNLRLYELSIDTKFLSK